MIKYSNLFMMAEIKLLSILSYFIPNKIIYCSKSSRVNHLANGFKKTIPYSLKTEFVYQSLNTKKNYGKF